ncbi:beta-galactosidase [Tropicimonas sp. IMCC6043]|uniref:beta-galactosidase n=1 Tax=Tropicimonas sp. IMCC6043 TaxID=2510645 RepID=UPI00101BA96B|nr:beta-galactosidase [Tropicimonas sp. IMCC6043]RYH06030.1 beta-galactosidase [Tropicimonas sp. IMCC6043]
MPRPTEPRPLSVWRPIETRTFLLGAAHYPEQVAPSFLQRDAERMAEAGFNVVRLAEFAWNRLEPQEGVFDFSFFDRAIEVFAQNDIKTILCTPTATPPRWLTLAYPEVLRVDVNGRPTSHGSRQHADTTNPVFRDHSRRITRAMAGHYAGCGHIIGWQTDNELNHSVSTSYSDSAAEEFRKFLATRYGEISALNFAWGGDVWSTGYQSFEEVVLPFDMAPVSCGPGHVLDYHRFLAWATERFQREQVDILREANSEWFIYHNVGRMNDLDLRGGFARDLDFLGYDVYPLLQDERLRSGSAGHAQAFFLDIVRGNAGNFLVPEQMSGPGSQPLFSTLTPEPGEMRRMAYSSIAHGADGILFFRWRPAHSGAEIYWGGLLDHDDVPRRRYHEAAAFASEVKALESKILGTHVHMNVGIAGSDFDNQEAHAACNMGLPSLQEAALVFHRHCHRRGMAAGFIHPEDDLASLKLLFVPNWPIWNSEWTAAVDAWVRKGGTLILGARTGSRDSNNRVIATAAPGHGLANLSGITVEEFGRLTPPGDDGLDVAPGGERYMAAPGSGPAESARRRYHFRFGGREYTAAHLYETLEGVEDTDAVGVWSSGFLMGKTAISKRNVEQGQVYYVGTYLTEDLMEAVESEVFTQSGISPIVPELPEGCEAVLRVKKDTRLLFLLNTSSDPVDFTSQPEGRVMITDAEPGERLRLPPHGCHILSLGE